MAAGAGTEVKGSTHKRYDLREGWSLEEWLRSLEPAETYRGRAKVPQQPTPKAQPAVSQSEPRSFDDIQPPAPPPKRSTGPTAGPARTPAQPAPLAPAPYRGGGVTGATETGAGVILALMFWTWVALPFLKSGPTGVRNVLRAKWFNKAPDGTWLP